MSQSGRRNNGRGRSHKQGRGRIDYHSKLSHFDREEDSATFWQRSNARLGIDEGGGANSRAVEYPCAVCGVFVGLDRLPKDRHDVVCQVCKGALGGIYDEEDQAAAADYVRTRSSKQRGMLDGLPEMSEEDLEAIGSIKALFDNQNTGRSGNRRRGPSNKGKRRRPGSGGHKSHSGDSNAGNAANRGGTRRRRRGGRRPAAGGPAAGGRGAQGAETTGNKNTPPSAE